VNRIMLDLETMGNGSSAAIIAIGAVRFDEEKTFDPMGCVVDLQSSVEAGLVIDPSTVLWWMQQGEQARGQFNRKGVALAEALDLFSAWLGDEAQVWGNGVDFDNVILSNAYRQCQRQQPWPYWGNRCYRTLKNLYPQIKMEPREGTYHCATDDAENQARHLIRILQHVNAAGAIESEA